VVAFRNAGVPEAVQDGTTGLLVPLNSAADFEAAVDRLISDAGLRRQMGTRAKTYVRSAHDLDVNYRAMDDILRTLAA
jgi:glycosyltransferase involved in cell wall biosynthesis